MTQALLEDQRGLRDEPQDLVTLYGRYSRHIPLVIAVTLATTLAAAAYSYTQPKIYTAKATVEVSPARPKLGASVAAQDAAGAGNSIADQLVDTQVEGVKGANVAEKVVQTLGLDKDPEFAGKPSPNKPANPEVVHEQVVMRVAKSVKAKRVGQSALIEISFPSLSAIKSARIVNTYAQEFIKAQVEQKESDSVEEGSLLDATIQGLRADAEKAQEELAKYKADHNLLDAQGNPLAEHDYAALAQQYSQALDEETQSRAKLVEAKRLASSGSSGADVTDALASPSIIALKTQRSILQQKVDDMAQRYGSKYPDLIVAKQQLADTNAQIQQEIGHIMKSLETQEAVSHRRAEALSGQLGQAKGAILGGNNSSAKLVELQLQADAARKLYEDVLDRSKADATQRVVAQADTRIQTRATPPLAPSWPVIPLNLALGILSGLGLGVAAAFGREQWNVGLSTLDDVETKLGLAYLGSVPTVRSSIDKPKTRNPVDAVVAHPLSSFAEGFRGVATGMLYSTIPDGVRIVGFTSALPKEGKTTTSVCVTRLLAMSGRKVVLVDCDLRRRSTLEALGRKADVGLIEVLSGAVRLEDALLYDEATGAYFLPLAPSAHTAKSPYTSSAFDALLADLKSRFDLVILDTAPVLPVIDTRLLVKKVDALVMLVKWRHTPARAVRTAVHLIESVGGRFTGVALTQVDQKEQARSGYGDPGYYAKDFKGYYIE